MRTCLIAAALISLTAGTASAATVTDAQGDFAPGYLGAAPDLDLRSFSVTYNAATQIFSIGAMMDGAINSATAGVYVIGVNTGLGANAPFGPIGAPNVRFDTTFRVNKDGTTSFGAAYTATISGSTFIVNLPQSLFTSTGRAPEFYGFNLWPRNGVGAGTFVTDFAPNDGLIASAPEPAAWMMMIIGFGAVGAALRSRRRFARIRRLPA